MSTLDIKNRIAELVSPQVGVSAEEIAGMFELPKQPEHGDLALPCFRFAKQMRKAPPVIAKEIFDQSFGGSLPNGVSRIEPMGGYLNFTLDTGSALADRLKAVLLAGNNFGNTSEGNGKKVLVEFSSVNIAKPFGVGHLRTTILGAALARIYAKLGYETVRINHLGDWGTQFGNLIAAYRMWGSEYKFAENPIKDLYQLYVRYHAAAKEDASLVDKGRDEFRKLEQGDKENHDLWERFIEYSMIDFSRVYHMLNVEFDYYTGESFYRDKMDAVIKQLEDKKLLMQSDGATIVDLEEFGLPPCLIKKSDESTLYATRDLTALLYRKEHFKFDKILYVVGSSQKLHFQQFFKVAELMGNDWVKNAIHVEFGWVKFGEQAMSTRSGTLIFFEDVITQAKALSREIINAENPDVADADWTAERVAVAALIFTQLRVRRNKDVNFVWEEALSFKGETGPYLQYTHARLSSLIQKYGKTLPEADADLSLLGEEEKNVIKWFEIYPERLRQAAESYETSGLADFLLNLAGAFNSYWQRIRIITDDAALTKARMQMAYAVRIVLANGLRVLGIEPLEKM
ncbi:MAG: arginine--tRNA ligase [bacterium]|nr:arginine--tRNA ligase [bacterium]